MAAAPRVLSIQSSVVYGYVGNKAAMFPLQLLGIEADPINSVQLSNHTGYEFYRGQKLSGDDMWQLVEGLEKNHFLEQYSHLLSGYIGSVSFLERLVQVATMMKERNRDLVYVCDPVLGDDGRLYVPPEFVPIYRDRLLPLASVATPNQTEAEFLTDVRITDRRTAFEACQCLHRIGVRDVIITSSQMGGPDVLDLFASRSHPVQRLCMRIPRVPGYFSGTGDLTSALILAHLHRSPNDLRSVLEKTVATVQAVLAHTLRDGRKELSLVQSAADILEPRVEFVAELVTDESLCTS